MKRIQKALIIEHKILAGVKVEREILERGEECPYIINLIFAFETSVHWYMCMEFCAGGEVYTLLSLQGPWMETRVKHYAAELVLALEWMHKNNYMHRDLKSENIMIDKNGHSRLIDFGVSRGNMPNVVISPPVSPDPV